MVALSAHASNMDVNSELVLQPIGWTFRLLEFWSPAVRAIRLALTWRMRTGYLSDDSTTTIRYLDRTVIPHIRPGCAYGGHNSPYSSALSESDFDFAMSSDADAAAETVALFQNFYTSGYCYLAASVLFIYDTLITLDRQVACFWTAKRPTGASLLFFANKWISMTLYVMTLSEHASFSSNKVSQCSSFVIAAQAVVVLQFIPWAAFSALRAYVLSRSKPLGLLILALSVAPAAANLVLYGYHISGVTFAPFGCLETDLTTSALNLRFGSSAITSIVVVASRVPPIVADILLIYITWTKLKNWGALRNIRQSKRLSLSDILFRGGTMLFILNVLHLILTATAVAGNGNSGESIVATFTGPITAILVLRFLLDLQEANQTVVGLGPDYPSRSSRNPYDTSSIISSLGGFVNPDFSARLADDDSEVHGTDTGEPSEEGAMQASPPGPASTSGV
ncbi:hypothetical protein K466DRAFT_587843 [Polyporus arcularius HHB13444]|uniref:DUF6533 domain-containing protein n=1 Tax=Polyporus arcularius HHB13444 TaxID=1314778 RepID=A0A5C3PIL4_9APHY|nr:hypothetical protein K466DRAFT_587843 [Polyporus arcularius HHB13444]